ncbi:MAG TPA: SDR family oxidoreductase [Solirubrobacteraceae bacterium]|nr:SDR family oxidoreductase [Solirubrobacteraceae bacterium]
MTLSHHVAVVAGATRGGGRAVAIELGAAGATVYVTGRSAGGHRSPMDRPETLEETAALVRDAGGTAILAPTDHTDPAQVRALADRIAREQHGRLDLLVNNVWGGDRLAVWDKPFWEHDLDDALEMQRNAVWSHLITAHALAPPMVACRRGLIVEVTDGIEDGYRGTLPYDLVKASVIRLALAEAADLRPHGVAALALTPGFLRSEAVLDHLGVTAENWRDGIERDPHFAFSETPRFLGRAIVALASDPAIMDKSGGRFATWGLAHEYGFDDVDGARPDWGAHAIAAGLAG